MRASTKHLPMVGVLGLVLIGAAAGSLVYYQYVNPPPATCSVPPVHRMIFMTAVIQELGGFQINNTAILNQETDPEFSTSTGANLTGVSYQNVTGAADSKTIRANIGDTVTLYIRSVDSQDSRQQQGATGHGFDIAGSAYSLIAGELPDNNLAWGTWYTVTVKVTKLGTFGYLCTQFCSPDHGSMRGSFVAGCGV